jgi:predicted AAA+ superfamily ATPase
MRNILDLLIDDFHERPLPELMPRQQSMAQVAGKASCVVGMRRAGKTWFCYQQMRHLLAQGIPKEQLLYLNFEDERLLPFSATDFHLIFETYFQKFPAFKHQQCYLFLDEVQRIEGWDMFVRRVLDTEQLSVYVTGSSSKLLSTDIATSLRGRSLTTEIFPFSFREFLRFHQAEPGNPHRFGSATRAVLQHQIGVYLTIGGFPEVQGLDAELRRQVLRNYVDVVILRDVIERYSISNVVALRALIRHIMSAPATRFSVNKFYHALRSQGVACTKNDLYAFLEYLTDAFLVYTVPTHARSEHVCRVNPKKVYAIDTGLLGAMAFHTTEDRGALLENLVYMHLRRQGMMPEYYITQTGSEADFVVLLEDGGERQLIQVCWDLGQSQTWQCAVAALLSAMEELQVQRGTIVTWLDADTSDDRLTIMPAWQWLLEA